MTFVVCFGNMGQLGGWAGLGWAELSLENARLQVSAWTTPRLQHSACKAPGHESRK